MGPVNGMSPETKAETAGIQNIARLKHSDRMGTLPEAVSAAGPKATSVDRESADDEELTNLNWLHEDTNLLKNFSLGDEGFSVVSPFYDIEGDGLPSFSPPCSQNQMKRPASTKPPYSFSLLIYMAIEGSPNKCLPVKEIYSWILEHFPYFATAPTGWKNSVRHNLSLNKCFRKVERGHGKTNGKGSLWCVEPEYKPNLLQALRKQPYCRMFALYTPPASPSSASSPTYHITSVLKQHQGCPIKAEPDIDAATAMMLLNSSFEQRTSEGTPSKQLVPVLPKKRSYSSAFEQRSTNVYGVETVAGIDPKEDHNYSATTAATDASHRCESRSSVSSLSSVDEVYEFVPETTPAGSDGSEGFHSEEDTEVEDSDDPLGDSGYSSQKHENTSSKVWLSKKPRKEVGQEIDEELKEAAGSLLHLAGIRMCLDSLISTAKAKSKKHLKN
ncbi:forkhead box protein N2 [Protopterus annectens]|uniref:forkhead box protein N2 n=1 Tax=Protopterus annectens TaxID=7888 RepID=UPI001CFBDB7D|nr:forkhead box protein N2 [Protopterus annectens]